MLYYLPYGTYPLLLYDQPNRRRSPCRPARPIAGSGSQAARSPTSCDQSVLLCCLLKRPALHYHTKRRPHASQLRPRPQGHIHLKLHGQRHPAGSCGFYHAFGAKNRYARPLLWHLQQRRLHAALHYLQRNPHRDDDYHIRGNDDEAVPDKDTLVADRRRTNT